MSERPSRRKDDMERALESGAHEGLNDLEYAFLVELAREEDAGKAAAIVGVGGAAMGNLLRKLAKMDLVEIMEGDKVSLLPELKDILGKDKRNGRTIAVLGQPKAAELYRSLKMKYGFVFPELPLAAFIRPSAVEHVIKGKAERWYFLTCRVDFLVCDRDGFPLLAFEYQGGGHEKDDRRKKDALKRKFLEAAGIPLHEAGSGVADKLPGVDLAPGKSPRAIVSEWSRATPSQRFESYIENQEGESEEPEYPITWNHLKREYVAVLDFKQGKVNRRFLGKRVNPTRDNRSFELHFSAEENPGALPMGTVLEIRDGSHKYLYTSYYRKEEQGWKLLKRKEGASALFQKADQENE